MASSSANVSTTAKSNLPGDGGALLRQVKDDLNGPNASSQSKNVIRATSFGSAGGATAKEIVQAAGAMPQGRPQGSAKTMEQRYISKLYNKPPSLDKSVGQAHKTPDQVKAHLAAQSSALQEKHAEKLVRIGARQHQEQEHLTQRQKEKIERVKQDQELHNKQQTQRLETHQKHQQERLAQEAEQAKLDRIAKLENNQRLDLEKLKQRHIEQRESLLARLERDTLLYKHAQGDLLRKQEGEKFALGARQYDMLMKVVGDLSHRHAQSRADLLAKQRVEMDHKRAKQENQIVHLEKKQQRHHPEAFMGQSVNGQSVGAGLRTVVHTPGMLGVLRSVLPF